MSPGERAADAVLASHGLDPSSMTPLAKAARVLRLALDEATRPWAVAFKGETWLRRGPRYLRVGPAWWGAKTTWGGQEAPPGYDPARRYRRADLLERWGRAVDRIERSAPRVARVLGRVLYLPDDRLRNED